MNCCGCIWKKEGYAVTQAYDGEAAFEAFEREKPNLVLLDVMMPKMDGWEVCQENTRKGQHAGDYAYGKGRDV